MVCLFRYSDTGAPTLNGTAGALAALLDAVLINGYNTKTVSSITIASGIATINFATAHGYQQAATINLSGANESAWNKDFFVLSVPTSTSLQVSAGALSSPPTGTIATKNAPLGWTTLYTATNKRAYKSANGAASGLPIRFDDTGTTTAVLRGYVAMSDVDTGTENYYNFNFSKSSTADATARPWVIVGDDKFVMLFTLYNVALGTTPAYTFACFGDFKALNATDVYNFIVANNSALITSSGAFGTNAKSTSQNINTVNAYTAQAARSFSAVPNSAKPVVSGSAYPGVIGDSTSTTSGNVAANGANAISPLINGYTFVRPVYVQEVASSVYSYRGEIPGMSHVIEKASGFSLDGTVYLNNISGLTNGGILIKAQEYPGSLQVIGSVLISLDAW